MPQALLAFTPDGASRISDRISVVKENGRWTWLLGIHPICEHPESDRTTFRWFTAQLIQQGNCRQCEIVKAFGVSANAVKRAVKLYQEGGVEAFYRPRGTRAANVITADVIAQAEDLLRRGRARSEVADQLGIKRNTLSKAIQQGRLKQPCADDPESASPTSASPTSTSQSELFPSTDKSQRSVEDAVAGDHMGVACTRVLDRVSASIGLLPGGAVAEFQNCRDVSLGGVLCALPALHENGLFRHLGECFPTLDGYYTTVQVVSLLSFMALCRIKTIEQLQYVPPGELGKLLGLDRVPEVRCLRKKLGQLSLSDNPEKWSGRLSRDWLAESDELAGLLYVDGHVRVYHGKMTELPRRYVARMKLCLRGTTDYWVNDSIGQPFFVVNRPIDQGLIESLESDIVPRLLQDVPDQPTDEQLKTDPYRSRFTLLFDREGYSPKFFKKMWNDHRIACTTYHKFPKGDWPTEWFTEVQSQLPDGQIVSLKLAELGSWIGGKDGLWVHEVRKLTQTGHQTSVISTAYDRSGPQTATSQFCRWSQENFFRYMNQHYALDLLSEYQTCEIPETKRPVVNPPWRDLDKQIRSLKSKLTQRRAKFASLTLHPEDDAEQIPKWEQRKAELQEEIEQLEHELSELKTRQKVTPHHVSWQGLPDTDKFEQLAPSRKRLQDTVRMVAYRAETAMANVLREVMSREDDARTLLRDLFRTEANLIPDAESNVLQVQIHSRPNPRSNRAIRHLLNHLNEAELLYPGTPLKLVYTLLDAHQN